MLNATNTVETNIEIKARSGGGLNDYVMKFNVRSKDFGPNKECWHYKATLRFVHV